jgi:peptidoglycan/LPS O-acetylase OafA/YrhL
MAWRDEYTVEKRLAVSDQATRSERPRLTPGGPPGRHGPRALPRGGGPSLSREAHHPQLDGLRALAVGMVVLAHTGGQPWFALFGRAGVTLFFVLSSFLITGILLRMKGAPLSACLRVFYARRALRIVPAYALVLIVLYAAHAPTMEAFWAWHALYLSNWLFAKTGSLPHAVGHFWTLSVEEQFYLAWPLLVLLLPTRSLGRACGWCIAVGVASRGLLALMAIATVSIVTPTFAIADAFGLGALLAWQRHHGMANRRAIRSAGLLGLLLLVVATAYATPSGGGVVFSATERLAVALLAVWAVDTALDGRLSRVFASRPVRLVGTISYGIYLWHAPIIWAIIDWAENDPIAREAARGGVAMFAAVTAITLVIALLSWYGVERPINRLKRHFPYPAVA